MSGGGARAAYQVGLLRCLAKRFPDLQIPILTGVSAGAINAVHLAGHVGTLEERVESLAEWWSRVTVDQVFQVSGWSILGRAMRTSLRLVSGGAKAAPAQPRGLVDTTPLWEFLRDGFRCVNGRIPGINRNLNLGRLRGVAITASSYTTGRSVTWIQSCSDCEIVTWERAHRKSEHTDLGVAHVMASAALPGLFPAVEVEGAWYGDGGIRLTAPLSPAVHMGADRILAISTRYARRESEFEEHEVEGYPPPAQVLGTLLNALFLDQFDADALRLQRINDLLDKLPPSTRDGMRRIELLVVRPSRDLGKLANQYEAQLPRAFRFMTRGLGTRETRSNDVLSLVMFQHDYLSKLMELGEADAEAQLPRIEAFLEGCPRDESWPQRAAARGTKAERSEAGPTTADAGSKTDTSAENRF